MPDLSGDEADLKDETWCAYDGQIVDDELYRLWPAFEPGARVLVVSDSCHSGTMTKLAFDSLASGGLRGTPVAAALGIDEARYRYMPDPVALRAYRQNRAFYDGIGKKSVGGEARVRASVRLISGCQENQLPLDGTFNGLFTGTLLRVWSGGRFRGDYRDFHREIVRRMPPTQTPNHFMIGEPNRAYDEQEPFTI